MGFVKLTEPSQAHTMHISGVKLNSSGNWPDLEFTDGEDTVAVPLKAAERQFTRLKVEDANGLIGTWVKFSRSDKPGSNGKLFWNLDLASPPQPASKRLPPPERKPLPFDEEAFPSAAHGESVDDPYANPGPVHPARVPDVPPPNDADVPEWVEPKQTPREVAPTAQKKAAIVKGYLDLLAYVKEHGALADDNAIQAASATIWITWKDRGLLPDVR